MSTILVVDDEPAIRLLVRATLEREGHEVLEAADGPAALEATRERVPDLVLLDLAMPGMTGGDVCRRLRDEPAAAGTPVLLLTGLPGAGEGLDAQGEVEKPFTPDSLLARVQPLLRAA